MKLTQEVKTVSHLTSQPNLNGLGGDVLARYETGAVATLVFFAFCLGSCS